MNPVEYLTAAEVAAMLGKTTRMITHLCVRGRLPGAVKTGPMWLIPRGAALAYRAKPGRPKGLTGHEIRKRERKKLLEGVIT